ncbi:hypothetical protein BN1723_015981 [Verticillium longisporum]|uniref:Uncharacterized protein n=1 Tax=Verticillium longisporum TaxID=100787 RepID=A0A0G4N5Z5_VERLO|nr:hypothetical protein HYQ44_018236 [Verticillium longisporum]CRK37002.1 hypothetical protein BN1708_007257 [Verticillium longisporum]CRK41877.1 hypothetical protein BN1723_015981 [Verticillium longisporum]
MQLCQAVGRPSLYGLGIRLAFYLQWFGALAAEYIEIADMCDVRLLGLLLSAATLLGLVAQLAAAHLAPVEVYIALLLVTGLYLPLAPLWLWKAATRCHARYDPLRWSRETPSPAFRGLDFALLLALAGLGTWFWTSRVPTDDEDDGCRGAHVGFFFAPVRLGNSLFVAFHALLCIATMLVCAGLMLVKAGWRIPVWEERRRRRKTRRLHIALVQDAKAFVKLAVLATLTAAVEMTVVWNRIPDVNDVADAAQMIPLVVVVGIIVRAIFLHFARAETASETSSGSRSRGQLSRRSSAAESRRSSESRHSGSEGPDTTRRPPPVHVH